ncbi:hypothetical protein SUNI508_04617 [Seiridium unicorne]|uniref:Uncharacterized protein n=1 Tax=Seiridium unicorne TaxID=138068 RepID=A0ABR2V7R3_9PEZI
MPILVSPDMVMVCGVLISMPDLTMSSRNGSVPGRRTNGIETKLANLTGGIPGQAWKILRTENFPVLLRRARPANERGSRIPGIPAMSCDVDYIVPYPTNPCGG